MSCPAPLGILAAVFIAIALDGANAMVRSSSSLQDVAAAHDHPRPQEASPLLKLARRPVPLRTGIGSAHDAVSTPSREAQAFYDQGLAYLHSYVWLERHDRSTRRSGSIPILRWHPRSCQLP